MPGKPLCFTQNEIDLHDHITQIVDNKFGNFKIPNLPQFEVKDMIGKTFEEIQLITTLLLPYVIKSPSEIEHIYATSPSNVHSSINIDSKESYYDRILRFMSTYLTPEEAISTTTSSTVQNRRMDESKRRYYSRIEKIKKALGTSDNGQAMRLAAAGFCAMHDFRFLAEVFTNSRELVSPLQAPDPKKGYTPLQQALKNGHATRAAHIIRTGHLTEIDFTAENADKMSAQKYYDEALPNSPVRRNTLLTQRLKKK